MPVIAAGEAWLRFGRHNLLATEGLGSGRLPYMVCEVGEYPLDQ